MKITTLALTNFRSHQKTSLVLDRFTIIRGPNGAGKSSVQDALEYLLTGTTRQTDAGGRGADLLIQQGKQEMGVQATFAAGTEITRLRNRAGGSFMVRQPGKTDCVGKLAEAWMQEHFFPAPVVQACLNSGRFLSLSEKDQRNLLTSALASKPVEVSKYLLEAMKLANVPGIGIWPLVENAHDADRIYNAFYQHRTVLNRDSKALGELVAPQIPEDTPSAEFVRKQLDEVRKEREGHIKARERKLADHQANHHRLTTAREQLEQFKADILEDAELERMRKIASNGAQVAKLTTEIEQLTTAIHANRGMASQITNAPTSCPTCGQAVEQTDTKEQIEELERKVADDDKSRTALQAKLTKLGDPTTATQKVDAHKKAVIATGSAERAVKELKDLPEVCDVSDLEGKIFACEERIKRGEEILGEVMRLEGAKQQYDQATQRQQEIAKAVVATEQVIEGFGPTGTIRAQLVGDRIEGFRARLNEVLEKFGFRCWFEIEPFKFTIGTRIGTGKEVLPPHIEFQPRQLSESEAFRFSTAFQIALAEATGMSFVVIDRADILLTDVRFTIVEALLDSKLDQAIVLVAGEPMPIHGMPPETRFVDLAKDEHGRTFVAAEYATPIRDTTYEEMPQ